MLSSADYRLARRLEFGHADSGLSYAQAYLERHPESEIAFEQIGGGWAIFQGPHSPVTQALAVGMSGTVKPEELTRLQDFFHSRGSPAVIDLASMADDSMLGLLQERGVNVREISNVLARRIQPEDEFASATDVERVSEEDVREWARIAIQGFTDNEEVSEEQVDVVSASPHKLLPYFGLLRGERVAVAGMTLFEGLATFYGDSTMRRARRSGLQFALIAHRLREAAQMGCDLASASVVPGSSSHRNYERAGFQLIYSRIQVAIPKQED